MSTSLPPAIYHIANSNKQTAICLLIKEEWKHLTTIKQIIDLIDSNNTKIKELYNESHIIFSSTWGTLTWGLPPPWAIIEQPPLPIPRPTNQPLPNPPFAKEADN
jgi:hypothetical protein